jgi:hypothetical protein
MRGDLLHPPLIIRGGESDAAHNLGLADVQGRDPLDDLLIVAGLCEHRTSPPFDTTVIDGGVSNDRRVIVRGVAGQIAKLVLVLSSKRQQ